MKIKIPQHFRIGATGADVGFRKNLTTDDGYDGTFNKRTGKLRIESSLLGDKRDKTFGHELIEVIKENYNLKIPEDEMSSIANGLLEFLYQLDIDFDWSEIENKD